MIKKNIVKNSLFLYILTFSNYFIGLLLYPFLSRVLSIESFGLISFSMTYVLIFQTIVEFGFMISATALISQNRHNSNKINKIVADTISAKIILSIVSIVLFLLSAIVLEKIRDNIIIIGLFLLSSIATAFLPDFYYRGVERMKNIALRTLLVKSISLIAVIITVKGDSDILVVPGYFIIGGIIALVITFYNISRDGIVLRISGMNSGLKAIKSSSVFFLSRLAVSINQSIGSYFLGLKFSPSSYQMGVFSGATRLSSASEMFLSPIVDSLYPHMVHKKDYKLFKSFLVAGTLIWFFICAIVFLKSNEIMKIILGDSFVAGGDYLKILMVGSFFAFPNMMFGYPALSPINKSFHANLSIVLSSCINIIILFIVNVFNYLNVTIVCLILASSNIVILCYRFIVFYKFKKYVNKQW